MNKSGRNITGMPFAFPGDHEKTRTRLVDGTLVKLLRADPPPGVRLRTDEELGTTLAEALQSHDPSQDLHVFGYGSLMWNPALDVVEACVAHVQGWHRRFCFRMLMGRGTPSTPGAMLALDRGGSCKGMLYRIAAPKVQGELRLLWQREMVSGSYDARWITATVRRQEVRALTFVARRNLDRYIGCAPVEYVAELVRNGKGQLGTSREYFNATVETLARLEILDKGIERLRRAIARADEECPAR